MKKILAFLLLLAPFASAQVVVNPSGGGGISSGASVPTCTINSVVYIDASGNLACGGAPAPTYDATNIRLQVGTGSTTQAGWIFGYTGTSGYSGIWRSGVTPSITNYVIRQLAGGSTSIGADSGQIVALSPNNNQKLYVADTAGQGVFITSGTATSDLQSVTSTQTWNAAGVTFTGHKYSITDTASAAGSLHSAWYGGAAGTTALMTLDKAGILTTSGGINGTAYIQGGTNGSYFVANSANVRIPSTFYYGFSSASDNSTISDLVLYRDAAATLQMGADVNGAAVAQTFKAADGITGTDVAGSNMTIAGGRGTGAGAGGNIQLQTSPALATGTTAQTLQQRDLIVAKQFNLTSGAAATIAVVTLGNDTQAGGTVQYCIYGADATTAVSECGSADFNGVDVTAGAGGEVCTFTKVGTPAQAVSGATLATTFAATTGTDLCNLRVTSTITTIASPVNHYIKYRIINHGLSSTNVVTPQ